MSPRPNWTGQRIIRHGPLGCKHRRDQEDVRKRELIPRFVLHTEGAAGFSRPDPAEAGLFGVQGEFDRNFN